MGGRGPAGLGLSLPQFGEVSQVPGVQGPPPTISTTSQKHSMCLALVGKPKGIARVTALATTSSQCPTSTPQPVELMGAS